MSTPYLDICIGDKAAHDHALEAYRITCELLKKNAAIYGLPEKPEALDEEQKQILQELQVCVPLAQRLTPHSLTSSKQPSPLCFSPPTPLLAGRLKFALDSAPGLAKTRDNFVSLCKGDKGMCKNAPNKALHYSGAPIHRIVKGFIAQGGDVTRGNGSGGEVSGYLALKHASN